MNDLAFLKSWLHTRNPVGTTDREHDMIIEEFQQFFACFFNNSRDGISILDPDPTILGVNTALESWQSLAEGRDSEIHWCTACDREYGQALKTIREQEGALKAKRT